MNRLFALSGALVTVPCGLGIRALFDGAAAKYAGVALWATLVFFLIVLVKPELSWRRAFVVCVGISFVVEFLQLTPGPMALYRVHPAFALVFGTTFNGPDLPAYVVGAGVGALVWYFRARRAPRP